MKRYFRLKARSSRQKRQARNFPVQGGGACVLKLLLPRVQQYLTSIGGRILVPLFDSIVFQAPKNRLDEATEKVSFLMIEAFRELYPALNPKVDKNISKPWCWNKDGHADSIERFEEDPLFEL
jgi:DNA polymerase I-like protein with 3'-5' exonuclease and polymerase domains